MTTTTSLVGDREAKAVQWSIQKVADKPAVKVLFELVTAPHTGRRLEWTGWLTEAAVDLTANALVACGWDGVSLLRLNGMGEQHVMLRIGEEKAKNGKVYPRVDFVNELRSLASGQALTASELAYVEEMLLGGAWKRPSATAPRAPLEPPAGRFDDEERSDATRKVR